MTNAERHVVQAAVVLVDLHERADNPADIVAIDNAFDALAVAVNEWRLGQ